jgi:DNA-binding NarL/FixJ family response regulator
MAELPWEFTLGSASRNAGLLTEREREVFCLIAEGFETRRIAQQLYITENTVRTHVRNAMAKSGARTRAHLVALVLSESPTGS